YGLSARHGLPELLRGHSGFDWCSPWTHSGRAPRPPAALRCPVCRRGAPSLADVVDARLALLALPAVERGAAAVGGGAAVHAEPRARHGRAAARANVVGAGLSGRAGAAIERAAAAVGGGAAIEAVVDARRLRNTADVVDARFAARAAPAIEFGARARVGGRAAIEAEHRAARGTRSAEVIEVAILAARAGTVVERAATAVGGRAADPALLRAGVGGRAAAHAEGVAAAAGVGRGAGAAIDAFAISPCARPLPRGLARAISAYQKVGLLSRKCFTVAAREEPLARPERRAAQQNLARDDRREEALGEMAEAVVAVAREAEEIP